MEDIYAVLWLITALIAVIPVYVFWTGYRKVRSKDLLITAVAFTLFLAKSIILSMELFAGEAGEGTWYLDDEFWFGVAAVLDMIIIGLIAISFTRKFENGEKHETEEKLEPEEKLKPEEGVEPEERPEPNDKAGEE